MSSTRQKTGHEADLITQLEQERARADRAEQALAKEKTAHAKTKKKNRDLKKAYDLSKNEIFRLQMENKNQQSQLEAFRSNSKIEKLRRDYEKVIRDLKKIIRDLKKELADADRRLTRMRKEWGKVMDLVQDENNELLKACEKRIEQMWKEVQRSEKEAEHQREKRREAAKKAYEAQTKCSEVEEKNLKLQRRLNMNYETSSVPSSAQEYAGGKKKKIQNSREKTGKKPGGQEGRKFSTLKRREGNDIPKVRLQVPSEIADSPDWYETKEVITKQIQDIEIRVTTTDYEATVWRQRGTGARYHAKFPEGVHKEANYGSNLKALVLYLTDYCNVADEKVCDLLNAATNGEISPSTGFVNGIVREFHKKSQPEQTAIYTAIQQSTFCHIDGTSHSVNGSQCSIMVNVTPKEAYFTFTEHKGHEAVKATPIGQCEYQGYLIHDGESTFNSYGQKDKHQQCWAHPERDLKESILYEPKKTWNTKMLDLLKSTIHLRKQQKYVLTEEQQADIRKQYDEITSLGLEEYEYEPPNPGYTDGLALLNRLIRNRDQMLNCLDKPWLPHTNNAAEHALRCTKRHTRGAVTNRSDETAECYCGFLTVAKTAELREENVFSAIKNILAKPMPRKRGLGFLAKRKECEKEEPVA